MFKKIFRYSIIFVIFFASFTGCKKSSQAKIDEVTIFAVDTTRAVRGEIKNFIELDGDVRSKNEVELYPDMSGKLVSIKVKLGDYVYRNQIVAYVDPSKPGMNYNASPVKSTLTGTITSLPIDIGATVNPQMAIAKVGQMDQIEIITNVAEKYISKIKTGLNAVIKSQAYPDKTFNAVVTEVSPVVDPVSRMMEVRLKPDDPNAKLLMPGMFVEIKIITEKKGNIVKIPADCIVKRYGEHFIFVVKGGLPRSVSPYTFNNIIMDRIKNDENRKFLNEKYLYNKNLKKYMLVEGVSKADEDKILNILKAIDYKYQYVEKRKVDTGIQIEDKVEILNNLKPDEEVVLRGQNLLGDNSEVKVINTYEALTKEDVVE